MGQIIPTPGAGRSEGAPLRPLLLLGILISGILFQIQALEAQRTLRIQHFHVALEVESDGDLRVMESIRIRFGGSWNGFYRTIPVEYRTPQGFSQRLFLELEAVTDESGRELETEVSREGVYRKVKVWVPEARDAVRTITLRYSVPNALTFFEEHDELYWNVTGTEWDAPIQSASAMIQLPPGATGLRATAFTGAYGSSSRDALIREVERGFYFETSQPLGFREGLTVVVGWDPGAVERPGAIEKTWLFLRSNWLFFFPILSFLLMWRIWRHWGKDPRRRSIAPRYEPPGGLSPAEVGTLVDNRPDTRDVSATLVDLAVRGFLRVEESESSVFFGLGKDSDYRLVRLRKESGWAGLKPHEEELLQGLFGRGGHRDEVMLSDLKNEFYKVLGDIKDQLFQALKSAGFYRHRPDKVAGAFIAIGVVSLGLAIPGFQILAGIFFISPLTALLAGVLTALPVLGFGIFMPARTVKGARTLEEILGFQEFLDRVESDRYRRMITSPEMFEEYLPFAMALGVEDGWARAFRDLYTEPPAWYVGRHPHAFHSGAFVSDLSRMASQAGTVMTSQPRSTGSSGFGGGGGGGGFSGGGFGGGGGGGF
ncbi:MAG: DUF2207 domain-containing protein [Longimicrobiales bacterium]